MYTTIYCGCQYVIFDILYFTAGENANTHYLRINCVLQAHHENNAYCVRIKGVLGKYAFAHLQQPDGLKVAVKTEGGWTHMGQYSRKGRPCIIKEYPLSGLTTGILSPIERVAWHRWLCLLYFRILYSGTTLYLLEQYLAAHFGTVKRRVQLIVLDNLLIALD